MTRKHLFAITSLSIAALLAYANSLNGTWALDDIVAGKPVAFIDVQDFIGFRKVAYLTFALNQLIAPFSPLNFRLLNILIHILNTALVYTISYKSLLLYAGNQPQEFLRRNGEREETLQEYAFHAALLGGILFALHPVNINAVAYIVQRMASLGTFFVLAALLFYLYASQAHNSGKSFLLYLLCGVSIIAGIFSKENAVMAVPLILMYDYIFLSHLRWDLFRKRLLVVAGMGILSIGLAFFLLNMQAALFDVVQFLINPHRPLTGKGWMARDVYWTSLQHILTEFRVVSRYLLILIFPLPMLLVFDWWGFPVSQSFLQPSRKLLVSFYQQLSVSALS